MGCSDYEPRVYDHSPTVVVSVGSRDAPPCAAGYLAMEVHQPGVLARKHWGSGDDALHAPTWKVRQLFR